MLEVQVCMAKNKFQRLFVDGDFIEKKWTKKDGEQMIRSGMTKSAWERKAASKGISYDIVYNGRRKPEVRVETRTEVVPLVVADGRKVKVELELPSCVKNIKIKAD